MRIKSLRLHNIRSYPRLELSFPEGSVLLSGDIGSGKSTILLSIEFALFGLIKGSLPGSFLLRHGSQSGTISLDCLIDGKEVSIERGLKRSSLGVVQDHGRLVVDGQAIDGTPQELKSRMLSLLGYPESLLTKSKSLIFRYTVFTAQEEMKRILHENREERLAIIRRIFNIERYKVIQDNITSYSKELRSRISAEKTSLEAASAKPAELAKYLDESETLARECELKTGDFNKAQAIYEEHLAQSRQLDAKALELQSAEQSFIRLREQLHALEAQVKRDYSELERVKERLNEQMGSTEGYDPSKAEEIMQRVANSKQELLKAQKALEEISAKRSEFRTRQGLSEKLIEDISSLEKCPTCLQDVTPGHVHDLTSRERVKVTTILTNLERLDELQSKVEKRKESLTMELERLQMEDKKLVEIKARLAAMEENRARKARLEKSISESAEGVKKLKNEVAASQDVLNASSSIKKEIEESRKRLDASRERRHALDKEIGEKKAKIQTLHRIISSLKSEIKGIDERKKRLEAWGNKRDWLEASVSELLAAMEKKMLASVYAEFNSYFQDWFSTLIEDETISVRLDEDFAPVIEQNGHETTIDNLSGGERTSLALAYRLGLNKVINTFISSIKTKDLLILDEPTEGFSSEQLDRLRDVLVQAGMKQVIIVSHEAKMEGLVSSTISVRKQNHISVAAKDL